MLPVLSIILLQISLVTGGGEQLTHRLQHATDVLQDLVWPPAGKVDTHGCQRRLRNCTTHRDQYQIMLFVSALSAMSFCNQDGHIQTTLLRTTCKRYAHCVCPVCPTCARLMRSLVSEGSARLPTDTDPAMLRSVNLTSVVHCGTPALYCNTQWQVRPATLGSK